MADDETQIRELIERWAQAVHAGDLPGVLARHSADIVMYDVPRRMRGSGASRRTSGPGPTSSGGRRRGPSSS